MKIKIKHILEFIKICIIDKYTQIFLIISMLFLLIISILISFIVLHYNLFVFIVGFAIIYFFIYLYFKFIIEIYGGR
jgi:hypothetical protein